MAKIDSTANYLHHIAGNAERRQCLSHIVISAVQSDVEQSSELGSQRAPLFALGAQCTICCPIRYYSLERMAQLPQSGCCGIGRVDCLTISQLQ